MCERIFSFNADIYKVAKPRIEEVLQMTGLTTESHKKIGQLSKGYRQRVGLANALLIHNPDFDSRRTNYWFRPKSIEIRNVKMQDKTVFLSTHTSCRKWKDMRPCQSSITENRSR
jgi:ABC-2 type transport system ATP-binding protein